MGIRYQAIGGLLRKYRTVLAYSWSQRKEWDAPKRLLHETQFLPDALALQDTPVHPAPRLIILLIILFFTAAIVWAIFGKVDITAIASGKIVPDDKTKVIQPIETVTLKAIHVRDGQEVKAGDLLLELDATGPAADTKRLSNDLLAARFDVARSKAMLAALNGSSPTLKEVSDSGSKKWGFENRLFLGEYEEYTSKLDALSSEIVRRKAELRTIEKVVSKLEKTAPIARQRAQDFEQLLEKKFASRHAYLELEQGAIEQEKELEAQEAKYDEVKASLEEAGYQKNALTAETRRLNLNRIVEAEQKIENISQEIIKAEQRDKLMRLTAPVDGTVQELAVHTIGGVVTPAQALMMIVPKNKPLVVEAFIKNRDIGFIYPGQKAQVKIETFPFTKYGMIEGVVEHLSNDAIQDENLGLVYSSSIKLLRHTMTVENKTVNLTPGMAVTVEIKTGMRRLIEYFLDPLLQYKHDSLRER